MKEVVIITLSGGIFRLVAVFLFPFFAKTRYKSWLPAAFSGQTITTAQTGSMLTGKVYTVTG